MQTVCTVCNKVQEDCRVPHRMITDITYGKDQEMVSGIRYFICKDCAKKGEDTLDMLFHVGGFRLIDKGAKQ